MGKINKAGDFLSGLFRQYFDEETLAQARKTAGLFGSWEEVIKAAKINAASDHSRIKEFEKGVLVIEAEHPGWIQLLQTKQKTILHILQKKYPDMKIQGISFYLSKTPFPGAQSTVSEIKAANAGYHANTAADTKPLPAASSANVVIDSDQLPVSSPEENKAIHESLQQFKKAIEKRNRRNQHK